MDVKSYCDSVGIEMMGWKAKIYDVINQSEKLSAEEREKIAPMISQLHDLMDDLANKTEQLKSECPADWERHRVSIEKDMSNVKKNWKDAWGIMGEPNFEIGA